MFLIFLECGSLLPLFYGKLRKRTLRYESARRVAGANLPDNVSHETFSFVSKISEWRDRLFVAQTSVFEVCGFSVHSKAADRKSGGLRYGAAPESKYPPALPGELPMD